MAEKHSSQYPSLVKMAANAAIFVAFILVIVKSYAWFSTDAASMLASTTDSLLDLFASIMNFVILRFALAPADKEHKFGHGKAESLAGLVQSAFVLGSALILALHGLDRLLSPKEIVHSEVGIVVTVVAIIFTLLLIVFQRYVIRLTGSVAISADAMHYQSDLLLNAGVIAALLLSSNKWPMADGIFTILVALFLAFSAVKIVWLCVHNLMDRELPDDEIYKITQLVIMQQGVLGLHDLRTRQSGAIRFIQFHLELDDNLLLFEAHAISDQVEDELIKVFPEAEIFIHQDPQSVVGSDREISHANLD